MKIEIPHSQWINFVKDINFNFSDSQIEITDANSNQFEKEKIKLKEIKINKEKENTFFILKVIDSQEILSDFTINNVVKITSEQSESGKIKSIKFTSLNNDAVKIHFIEKI